MAQQRRLDVAEFQPVPAQLDLLVVTARVVQRALAVEPGPVPTAAEQPLARDLHEAGGAESRFVEVTARGHGAADERFAGAPGWDRVAHAVHHAQIRTGHRTADGRPLRPPARVALQVQGADQMRLGRPVAVEQAGAGQSGEPPADGVGTHQLLARGDHLAQPGGEPALADCVLGEQLQGLVRHEDPLGPRGLQPFQERGDVLAPLGAYEVEAAAGAQRSEDLLEGHVERQHRELLRVRRGGQTAGAGLPPDQVAQRAVVDLHTPWGRRWSRT
ncbi:hypothetical protein GCM10010345_69710 [Streptomyces canarius]|uniref:Uncharacterized protein n=1 Tax=Streptomyces canarius TaxID=285453 RepID=A0ABQ3D4C7_9ACTN|nr:hypothetical protein GCM10010345_69710 [Streptomyces canarius]